MPGSLLLANSHFCFLLFAHLLLSSSFPVFSAPLLPLIVAPLPIPLSVCAPTSFSFASSLLSLLCGGLTHTCQPLPPVPMTSRERSKLGPGSPYPCLDPALAKANLSCFAGSSWHPLSCGASARVAHGAPTTIRPKQMEISGAGETILSSGSHSLNHVGSLCSSWATLTHEPARGTWLHSLHYSRRPF